MVLKVESQSFITEVCTQVLLVKNCHWHAFQVSDFFPVTVFLAFDIIEVLNFAIIEAISLLTWVLAEEN